MKYEWSELKRHYEDKNYIYIDLVTPIGIFLITTDPNNHGAYRIIKRGREWQATKTVEEGKEAVAKYLRKKAEELQSFINPIFLKEFINSPQELIPIPKLEDDFNYLRGFYDGVNKQLNTINK